MAMIAITTSSSIRVKARRDGRWEPGDCCRSDDERRTTDDGRTRARRRLPPIVPRLPSAFPERLNA
jgi:hypothetical protein